MTRLIFLGSGAALSDAKRENTYLVLQGKESAILVDVGGSPVQRLLQAKVPLDSIDHVILTHYHADHLYGLPILLMDMWLDGRKKVLHLYGLSETIRVARAVLEAFDWQAWHNHGFFSTEFHTLDVPPNGIVPVLDTHEFNISATRTKHYVPTIALRFQDHSTGKSIAYSCDTGVTEAVVGLARGADILIHEATTIDEESDGHTTAKQAGAQAQLAGVKKLVLVHLPPNGSVAKLLSAAKQTFDGRIVIAKDFMRINF
jgi:ribonuclease Z